MEQLIFGNLATQKGHLSLSGPEIVWPDLKQSDTLKIGWRPTQRVSTTEVEVDREIVSMKAGLGLLDESPTSGGISFTIDGTDKVFTADQSTDTVNSTAHGYAAGDRVTLDSTGDLPAELQGVKVFYVINPSQNAFQLSREAGGSAEAFTDNGTGTHSIQQITDEVAADGTDQELEDAINGLNDVGAGLTYGAASVEFTDRSFLITFDKATAEVPISVTMNRLRPVSFARVRAHEQGGIWTHEIRFIVAPIAFTSSSTAELPDPPEISEFQAGTTVGDQLIPEIQKITFNPFFRGTYQLRRNGARSSLLSPADGPTELAAAIEELADSDGFFTVTNPSANVGHIQFDGGMAGVDQDPLEVVVVDSPPADRWVTLDLSTWEVQALLRAAGFDSNDEADLVLELEVVYKDPANDAKNIRWTYEQPVTLRRELIWEGMDEYTAIDWLRPVDPTSYTPVTVDQISVGHAGFTGQFGDSTSETFDHNLDSDVILVQVRENQSNGQLLTPGVDYTVTFDDSNSLTIDLLGDFNPAPGADTLALIAMAAGDTSAFDPHTHTVGQVDGLQAILDGYDDRISALEVQAPGGSPIIFTSEAADLTYPLLPIFKALPSREDPDPASSIAAFDPKEAGIRYGALLPAVHDAATETLPDPLPAADDTYKDRVFEADADREDVSGGLRNGDFAACDGTRWYRVEQLDDSTNTYYPAAFNIDLFNETIYGEELTLDSQLDIKFGFEAAVLAGPRRPRDRKGEVGYLLLVEAGVPQQDTTPATTDENLDDINWDTVLIEHPVILTQTPRPFYFGVSITRAMVAAVDTLTAEKTIGRSTTSTNAPTSPDCLIRARLVGFDTRDSLPNPAGLVVVRGLSVGLNGEDDTETLGRFTITS